MSQHLTHWGRVTHICVNKLSIVGSDNGLSPDRRQAIIWTSAGILLIGPLGTNFSEILIKIHIFSLKKMHLKMSSAKWRLFGLGLNELKWVHHNWSCCYQVVSVPTTFIFIITDYVIIYCCCCCCCCCCYRRRRYYYHYHHHHYYHYYHYHHHFINIDVVILYHISSQFPCLSLIMCITFYFIFTSPIGFKLIWIACASISIDTVLSF